MPMIPMEDIHATFIDEGVAEQHQTLTIDRPFWVFFTFNMVLSTWLVGVFVIGMGLSFWNGLWTIFLGNVVGSLPAALIATMGPKSRLTQMESTRLSMGRGGARISSLLNWIGAVGWDAVNNIPSVFAAIALFAMIGVHASFGSILAGLVFIQLFIGIYGHHFAQWVGKYAAFLFIVAFGILGITALLHHPGALPVSEKPLTLRNFLLALSFVAILNASMGPYVSDYTRYLPKKTPSRSVFWTVFLGMFISSFLVEGLGLIMSSTITDQSPTAIIHALQGLSGGFAPLVLFLIAFSCIPPNACNDTSAAYCLISSGIRLPRPIAAVLGGAVGYALAVYGAGSFAEKFESFLLFLFYWIAPWTAIVLVDWFMGGRALHHAPKGWTWGATIFCVVTVLTIALFAVTDIYTGPVAKALGGIDIGFYVGFVVAGVWYAIMLRHEKKKQLI